MFRITPSRIVTLAASAFAFAGLAAGQSKVAVVSIQQALADTAEINKASADLEAKYRPRQADIDKLRADLDGIQTKLQQGQGKLTQQQESDLNYQGQRKQRDMQRLQQDLQEEVDAERNAILSNAGQRMKEIIRKIADSRGYDVVVEAGGTLYIRPTVDITKDATAEFNKAYPAQAAAAPAPPAPAKPKP